MMDVESLVREHGRMIGVLCRKMLGPGEDSIDAAQEIWMEIVSSLRTFRGESSLATWIYSIARRKLLAMQKARRQHDARHLYHKYRVESLPTPDPSTDMRQWARQMCERCMQGVLFCLEPLPRLVFVFRFVIGLDYSHIAQIVEKSEVAVRQVASRSRRSVDHFLFHDCAYHSHGASCRCGMETIIRKVRLPEEFDRVRAMVGRVHVLKLAEEVIPPFDYWRSYLPDFGNSVTR